MVAVDTPQLIAISIIGLLFVSFAASETTNVSDVSPIPPAVPVVDDPVVGGGDGDSSEDIDFNPNVTFAEGEIDLVENSELNITQDFTTHSDQHITPFNSTVDITSVQRNMPFTVVKYAADGDPRLATEFNSGNAGFTIADVSASPDNYLAEEGYLFQLYKNETQQANFYPVPRMTLFSIDSFTNGDLDQWVKTRSNNGVNTRISFKDTTEKLKIISNCNSGYYDNCGKTVAGGINESVDSDKEAVTISYTTSTSDSYDLNMRFGTKVDLTDYGKVNLPEGENKNITIQYNSNTDNIVLKNTKGKIVRSTTVPTTLEDEEFFWSIRAWSNDDYGHAKAIIDEYGLVPKFATDNWRGLTYVMPENQTVDVNGYDTSMTSTPEVRFSSDGGENFYAIPSRMEANNTVRFRHVGDPSNFEILVAQSKNQLENGQKSLLSFLGGL